MAYIQRFGINRNTPMNMVAPMKMVGGEDNQATNVIEDQNKKAVKEKSSSWLDFAQDVLVGVGTLPVVGNVADVANAAISGGRAVHAAVTGGDTKRFLGELALNSAAAIPAVGQGVTGARVAAKVGGKVLEAGKVAKKVKKAKTGGKYLLSTSEKPEEA